MSTQTRSLLATIAGFAALGFLVLSLVYWALLANPPLRFDNIDVTLRVLLIATIVSFAIFVLVSPESVGRAAGKRSNRLMANALVASLVALAIAIVLNILAESSVSARADWTAGQDFAISEQTKQILRQLDERGTEVHAIAFFTPRLDGGEAQRQAAELLAEYRAYTGKLRFDVVDIERDPLTARQYGVSRNGVVVFEDTKTKDRQTANSANEREFTSAVQRLLQTETKTVAFLSGHGERDPNNFDLTGYSQAKESLEQNNYSVITWRLVTSPTIGVEDVDVLVIAAPQNPLQPGEIQAIQNYLDAGGRALVLTDLQMPPEALQSIATLLRKYNVEPVTGAIIDTVSNFNNSVVNLLVENYPPHPINEALRQGTGKITLYPPSLGLRVLTTTTGLAVSPVVQSSGGAGASWLETNLNNPNVQFDPATDIAGPVNVGVAVAPPEASGTVTETQPLTQTRLVVFGNGDIAANSVLQDTFMFSYNVDLFGNSVSWLAGQNELVSIRPKEASPTRQINLDPTQRNLMFTTAVLGLPMLIVLLGGIVWWRRR
jgi:ABC-type uncharacterized transport system involved in gliding motility auxiliary subunit